MEQTERFQMRVSPEFLAHIDEWRRHAKDIPARAEAIRRLVGEGIASHYLRHRGDHLMKMLEDLHAAGRLTGGEINDARAVNEACMNQAVLMAAKVSGSDTEAPSISAASLERKVKPSPDLPKDGPFVRSVTDEKPKPTYPMRPPKTLK